MEIKEADIRNFAMFRRKVGILLYHIGYVKHDK